MAKTFAGKSLSGGLNKVADSVYGPIRRLKEINRALKKSLKVGTITEAELRRLLEEGEKRRRISNSDQPLVESRSPEYIEGFESNKNF